MHLKVVKDSLTQISKHRCIILLLPAAVHLQSNKQTKKKPHSARSIKMFFISFFFFHVYVVLSSEHETFKPFTIFILQIERDKKERERENSFANILIYAMFVYFFYIFIYFIFVEILTAF